MATLNLRSTITFFTHAELAFAKRENKGLYHIPMTDRLQDPKARVLLGTVQAGPAWREATPTAAPQKIVDGICALLGK